VDYSTLKAELSQIGGSNPLLSFEVSSFGQIDLSRAHPGGMAQLVSARQTTISNLVRDGVAQARSLSAARRIRAKAKRVSETFGTPACFIACGVIQVGERRVPIALWPAELIPKGDDFDLRLGKEPALNPEAARLIRDHRPDFQDRDLLAIIKTGPELLPAASISFIQSQLSDDEITVEHMLVLGNFVTDMLLTVVPDEPRLLFEQPDHKPVEPLLVADADSYQILAITAAAQGKSFAVETLPGCGYIQTAINILANLTLQGKRTLIIAPREQTVDEFSERLGQLGLAGLAIRANDVWVDAVAAISRHEKAQPVDLNALKLKMLSNQAQVQNYFDKVSASDSQLGISLTDALNKLAALAGEDKPPTNSARIRPDLLIALHESGPELIEDAHRAGAFQFGPQHSPWFGANFESQQQLDAALTAVKSIAGEEFRLLSYQINRYLQDQNLIPAQSVEDWSKQLSLLIGIRETIDKFKPQIFDRSLREMILATAVRGERGELSGAQRRRFKKLAKEFVRPGATIANLHAALAAAEQQRVTWLEVNTTQAPPSVPLGLNDTQQKFEQILTVLNLLQRHLDSNPDLPLLTQLSFEDLAQKLSDLAEQTEILNGFLDRAAIAEDLRRKGLQDLYLELCRLEVDQSRAVSEFELCWWQSALEALVAANPEILEYDANSIADIEAGFDTSSKQLVEAGPHHVSSLTANRWREAIQRYPAQADELRNLLRARSIDTQSAKRAGAVWEALSQSIITSPFRVHSLSGYRFDALLVLDAAATGVAEAAQALKLADQVIAFGDPVISAPESFETVARANQGPSEATRSSVFDLVSANCEVYPLRKNYRIKGQVLGTYLNQTFYHDRLELEVSADSFHGASNLEQIEITQNANAASTIEGATESLDAEVDKVAELVLNHARWTPSESLMVVTPSRVHAERVMQAVQRELATQPQLAEFFAAHGRESFEVLPMSEIVHRIADRVIFSVGFGRTPEGRISGSLGDFNSPSAGRWMVNQIASARKRLTVVSCYNFEDFAGGSLPENQRWLKDLIAPPFMSEARPGEPDPLLRDLALRLRKLGVKVELNFAGRIALAASYRNQAAAIDPDWSLTGNNWDEKLRLRPNLLRAMGWQYLRVHAFEIFATPQDVANRIATSLGVDLVSKREPLFEEKAFEDNPRAWGDGDDSNDDRLRDERPPHWG
jgi:hypothetical protein